MPWWRRAVGHGHAEPAAAAKPAVPWWRRAIGQLAVLAGFAAAGIAVTWPHASYLTGRLPATLDAGSYVWGFWWMAHAVGHLTDPWFTSYLAAPVGAPLGLHALMPLAGVVMLPVTALFGPSASYTLLSVLMPGLLGYAMYRLARLWVRSQLAAMAAGCLYGFSPLLSWQGWTHLNLAAGALFLPMTLEAAVRLRRRPRPRQAIGLGLVLGASVLVDQQSAVMATILAAAALLPWLLGRVPGATAATSSARQRPLGPRRRARLAAAGAAVWTWLARPARRARLAVAALAALVAGAVASPQLIAVAHEAASGGPTISPTDYLLGIRLPDMFGPSPRVTQFGLHVAHAHDASTFGFALTVLALAGLVAARRRLSARLLGACWLGAAALALGSVLHIGHRSYVPVARLVHGQPLSMVLPYTWFVRLPGMSGFREPSRLAELGLVAGALLAACAVNWLRYHAVRVLPVILAVLVLEAGLSVTPVKGTMPTSLPGLDGPIAADHSGSVVVDVPFGLRGGVGITGMPFNPETQVLATADGHPLGDALLSRVPPATAAAIGRLPFYGDLISAQTGHYQFTPAQLQAAAASARAIRIGWVLLWVPNKHLSQYLVQAGFRFDYSANGVQVFRPAADVRRDHRRHR